MHFIWKCTPSSIYNAFSNCLFLVGYHSSNWNQLISPHLFQLLLKQCPEINFDKLFLLHSSKVMMQCVKKLLFFVSIVLFRILKRTLSTLTNDTGMSYSLSPSPAILFKFYHALNIDVFVRMQRVWKESKKWKCCRLSTLFFCAAFICACVLVS